MALDNEEFRLYLVLLGFKFKRINTNSWKAISGIVVVYHYAQLESYGMRITNYMLYKSFHVIEEMLPVIEEYYGQ